MAAPWSCLLNLCWKENTQLFNTSSRREIILSLGDAVGVFQEGL